MEKLLSVDRLEESLKSVGNRIEDEFRTLYPFRICEFVTDSDDGFWLECVDGNNGQKYHIPIDCIEIRPIGGNGYFTSIKHRFTVVKPIGIDSHTYRLEDMELFPQEPIESGSIVYYEEKSKFFYAKISNDIVRLFQDKNCIIPAFTKSAPRDALQVAAHKSLEPELLENFRKLSPGDQRLVIAYVDRLLKKYK